MRKLWIVLLCIGLTACKETADLDPAAVSRGAVLAEDCVGCHSLEDSSNKIGPHLVGILGRQVASVSGYDYSEAMASQDFTWDTDRLTTYVLDPTAMVPGTKMAFGGIEATEAADLVVYLKSLE